MLAFGLVGWLWVSRFSCVWIYSIVLWFWAFGFATSVIRCLVFGGLQML